MVVTRTETQSLSTEWHSKPIASGRMLNFYSFHQYKHKINVAHNFIHRVKSLTTDDTDNHTDAIIHQHLQANNYPRTLVSRLINQYSNRPNVSHLNSSMPPLPPAPPPTIEPPSPAASIDSVIELVPLLHSDDEHFNPVTQHIPNPETTPNDTPQPEETVFRSLLYIPKLSDRLIKSFKKEYPHITIASRLNKTVGKFHSYVKDPKSKFDACNIIYKIPCNNCNSNYIGMTKNKLKTRLVGHTSHVNKLNKILESDDTHTNTQLDELREKTALIEHCIDHNHRFDFDKTCIIDRTKHTTTLPFLEMCHIYCTPHTVNRRRDVEHLNTAYAGILHQLKTTDERNSMASSLGNSVEDSQDSQ